MHHYNKWRQSSLYILLQHSFTTERQQTFYSKHCAQWQRHFHLSRQIDRHNIRIHSHAETGSTNDTLTINDHCALLKQRVLKPSRLPFAAHTVSRHVGRIPHADFGRRGLMTHYSARWNAFSVFKFQFGTSWIQCCHRNGLAVVTLSLGQFFPVHYTTWLLFLGIHKEFC